MQFGLFYEWPNPTLRNWKTLYQEGVEEIQYSEEMGFDYCLIAEHHFSNYGNSPAPLLQALHIGQQTKQLKIATGILVLPIWQPDAAMPGRVSALRIGGYLENWFAGYSIGLSGNQNELEFCY